MCLRVIGKGTSGVVYKGSYRGSVVAVKKVTIAAMPEKASSREAIASALEVEATRMGSLRHPNIVLFMGACLQQNHFCIVRYCVLCPVRRRCVLDSACLVNTVPEAPCTMSCTAKVPPNPLVDVVGMPKIPTVL